MRPVSIFPLVISAIAVVMAANLAMQDPRYIVPLALIVVMTLLPNFLARRRLRRVLMSGDVKRVLGTWEGSIDRVMYPETMAPLMAATAYAAYGWIDAARNALSRAVKGPAWDAALEQRLFVEALLDTYEGDRTGALEKARALESMPLPPGGWLARRKITMLRAGIAAMTRAFAHQSEQSDGKRLETAGSASPLIHWAMRYAAAVVAIDQGRRDDVFALLDGAPEWPRESAFFAYHEELLAQARTS